MRGYPIPLDNWSRRMDQSSKAVFAALTAPELFVGPAIRSIVPFKSCEYTLSLAQKCSPDAANSLLVGKLALLFVVDNICSPLLLQLPPQRPPGTGHSTTQFTLCYPITVEQKIKDLSLLPPLQLPQ
jgi:hypothetical protein